MNVLIRLFLTAILLVPAASSAATIETAYTRYYSAGEIRPLTAYLGGGIGEQRFRSVIPSDPQSPGGQYFIIKLADRVSGNAGTARMTYYTTDSKEPLAREWSLSGQSLRRWLYLGLTGGDWPSPEVRPLAWRVELLGTSGTVLAEWKSFLWEMP